MKRLKSLLLTVSAAMFVVAAVTAPTVVFAHNGEDHGDGNTSHSTTKAQAPQQDPETAKSQQERLKAKQKELEAKIQTLQAQSRQKAQDLTAKAKEDRAAKTPEQIKKACETRKTGLQKKVDNIAYNNEKYLSRVNEVLDKAKTYKASQNLTVENYDTLLASVETSQTQATASVNALKNLKPTIDCSKGTVASDVAAFKTAAEAARTDLKAYKGDVKELLKAIKTAAEAAKTEEQ